MQITNIADYISTQVMTILFLTDNFPPEYNAPATRTFEHCKEWVKGGHKVIVITCFPNFPKGQVYLGYKNKLYQREVMEGIDVIRVWTFIAPNKGTFKRTLDYLSYALMSFIAGLFVKCDVIVATSPQFFTAVSGCALSIFKRKKWIMEVRDIWPESISAVNAIQTNAVIRFLEKLEIYLYKKAEHIVVVTDSFKINLQEKKVRPSKISVVKNGVNLEAFLVGTQIREEIRSKLNLSEKFIVGYIGTHGLAHGLDFIIESISKIKDQQFHFLFIGDGAVKSSLLNQTRALQLTNVTFLDPITKEEVPKYLSAIDCALVPLKKTDTFEGVIPSKIFETAAAGIPILIGVNGEARTIVEDYNAGLYFEPENETEFLKQLDNIREKSQTSPGFKYGSEKLAKEFNRKILAEKMLLILKNSTNK